MRARTRRWKRWRFGRADGCKGWVVFRWRRERRRKRKRRIPLWFCPAAPMRREGPSCARNFSDEEERVMGRKGREEVGGEGAGKTEEDGEVEEEEEEEEEIG